MQRFCNILIVSFQHESLLIETYPDLVLVCRLLTKTLCVTFIDMLIESIEIALASIFSLARAQIQNVIFIKFLQHF